MTKSVRKAVIPAAGFGTRLLPATKSQPKEMLPIVDRPAVQYVVDEAARAGLHDVLLVITSDKGALEDYFDRQPALERFLRDKGKQAELDEVLALSELAQVHSVRQSEPLGLGHAVLQARPHVGDESFAVLLPDDIIGPDEMLLPRMIEVHERTGRAVVAVTRVPPEQAHLYGVVDVRPTSREDLHDVVDLIEKPSPDDAPSELAIIGRYVLPAEVFDDIEAAEPGRGGEIQLTDALRTLAAREPMVAIEFTGVRYDVGDKQGFLRATVAMAAERPDLGPDFLDWLVNFVRARKEQG